MLRKKLLIIALLFIGYFLLGCATKNIIPVEGATKNSWNANTFWYHPWGNSVVHHGIDIFAKKSTPVLSSTNGIVILCRPYGSGGNSIIVLSPFLKLHYYAHLDKFNTNMFDIVKQGEKIGTVGDTGNAKGKEPHLHYGIMTPIPYIWRWDKSRLGWKKMFYLNPGDYIQ